MSLKSFGILPGISSRYTLLRRENEGQSEYMSQCLASVGGSAHRIKTCELMDKAMEEKAGEIFNCVRKCKDEMCQKTCMYSVLGVDLDAVLDSPYANASIECTKGKDSIVSCTASCKRTDMKCNVQCFDEHKYDNVSCVGEKLEVSEDQIKQMIDCPEDKCVNSSDMTKHFDCISECQKLSQDSAGGNKDSKNLGGKNDSGSKDRASKNKSSESGSNDSMSKQANQSSSSKSSPDESQSAKESASSRIAISNLITLGLVLVSLSFNIQ